MFIQPNYTKLISALLLDQAEHEQLYEYYYLLCYVR